MDGGDCDDGYICVVWSRCYRTCCTVCHTAIASMQQSPAIAAAIASNLQFRILLARCCLVGCCRARSYLHATVYRYSKPVRFAPPHASDPPHDLVGYIFPLDSLESRGRAYMITIDCTPTRNASCTGSRCRECTRRQALSQY